MIDIFFKLQGMFPFTKDTNDNFKMNFKFHSRRNLERDVYKWACLNYTIYQIT